MTAPARTRTSTSRTTEREHFPSQTGDKPAKRRARAESGTVTRHRSTTAERAYTRRDQRRARSLREDDGRVQRRRAVEQPQRQRVRQPAAKRLPERVVSSRVPLVVTVMALLACGLAATLWLAIAAVSGSYRLQEDQTDINALIAQRDQLIRQNSDMNSTPELQKRATALGMVPAPQPAYLVPQPNGSVTVIGQPQAAVPPPPPPAPPAPAHAAPPAGSAPAAPPATAAAGH